MKDFGLLVLRAVSGGLLAGHGAQKLFGWFGGGGLEGTDQMMEKMGLKPARQWAILAGASEFGGGLLTALGAGGPAGSVGIAAAMGMATAKVHWGKPIWNTKGGAELPLINTAIALGVGLIGPGKFSVDNLLGVRVPRRALLVPGLALAAGGVTAGVLISKRNQMEVQSQAQPQEQAAQSLHQAEEKEEAVRAPAAPELNLNNQEQTEIEQPSDYTLNADANAEHSAENPA